MVRKRSRGGRPECQGGLERAGQQVSFAVSFDMKKRRVIGSPHLPRPIGLPRDSPQWVLSYFSAPASGTDVTGIAGVQQMQLCRHLHDREAVGVLSRSAGHIGGVHMVAEKINSTPFSPHRALVLVTCCKREPVCIVVMLGSLTDVAPTIGRGGRR